MPTLLVEAHIKGTLQSALGAQGFGFLFITTAEVQWCDVFLFLQGLLLLQQLTKSNAAIQKIVAFENAFERLLDIITEEGSSDGG